MLVTFGVYLTTTSNSASPVDRASTDPYVYSKGVAILVVALFLSSYLGLVQERTMAAHQAEKPSEDSPFAPPHLESLFYLHVLALPMFLPLSSLVQSQFFALGSNQPWTIHPFFGIPSPYVPLALNAVTQLVCVTGVHRLLTSSYSVLTVNLVLVIRKVVSLMLSVLMDGNWRQPRLWTGASLVTLGTILYAVAGQSSKPLQEQDRKRKDL
jgi:UDP-xylose/UDP-N-acetylglucosamine transporter B4